jgi:hypothetical protein
MHSGDAVLLSADKLLLLYSVVVYVAFFRHPAACRCHRPPASGDAGAGSSKQQAGRSKARQQQAQQQEDSEDEQPGPAVGARSKQQGKAQQQTRTGLPPVARPSRQQQRSSSNNAVGAATTAAAAAGGSSGGVSRRSDSGPAGDEQCEKVRRRALRAKLARLEADAAANKSLLLDCSSGELASRLLKLADLGAQATRPREAAQHAGARGLRG